MAEIKTPGSADTQLVGTPPGNVGAAVTTIAGTTPVKSENLSSADQSSVFGDGSSQRPLSSSGGGGYSLDVLEDGDLIASGVTALDFTGSGVSLTNAGSGQVTINIPGGGGGGIGGGGTLDTLAKFTPDGTHVGDSSITDDGVDVGMTEPIKRTLADSGSGGGQFWRTDSQLFPGTVGYSAQFAEGSFSDPFPYEDFVYSFGYNWDGTARVDTAKAAQFVQMEHQYQLDNDPAPSAKVTEFHLNTIDVNGVVRRPIAAVAAWDGGFGEVGLAGTVHTFRDWSDVQKLKGDFSSGVGLWTFFAPAVIQADTAPLQVKNTAGSTTYLAVDSAEVSVNVPLAVTTQASGVLRLENANVVPGNTVIEAHAGAGTKLSQIIFAANGDTVITNRDNAGATTYIDSDTGGTAFRNAAADKVVSFDNAGMIYRWIGGALGPSMVVGGGTPESTVTARPGSIYQDDTNGDLYVKKTGTGNTGWKLVVLAP